MFKNQKRIVSIVATMIIVFFVASPVLASHRTRFSSKIRDLDNDPVKELSFPVLFGVTKESQVSNFGDPRGGGTRLHEGLDIFAPIGTPIVSPTEAVVLTIDTFEGAGRSVITANPGDERFHYYHLDSYGDELDEGDVIKVGDLIGYVGDTGNAAGGPAHLHFEIREDGDPLDPFLRLTEEFSLKEKMGFLEIIMRESGDEDEFAEFLVSNYLNVFILARTQGIEIPEEIVAELPPEIRNAPTGVPLSDLSLGSSGADVTLLQSILITREYLLIPAPTGYFGPATQTALITYQRSAGLPATGYYGPLTRASLLEGASTTQSTTQETLSKIAELTAELNRLQALLNAQ